MLKEYLKRTSVQIPFSRLLFLNLPFFALSFIFFIALPLFIRRHYIIEESLASFVKIVFLFSYQFLIVPTALCIQPKKDADDKKPMRQIFIFSLLYGILKTLIFILHLFLFRLCFAWNQFFTFLTFFALFFVLLTSIYLPQTIAKNVTNKKNDKASFIASFKASFAIFTSHPFFASFIFLHSLFLLFLSPITLFLYPSLPHILYNIRIAYEIIVADI